MVMCNAQDRSICKKLVSPRSVVKIEGLGKNPTPEPKILIFSIFLSQPTLSVSKMQISIICDHGGPDWIPQTAIHIPETLPFHLATIFMGKNPTPEPRILIFNIFLSQPTLQCPKRKYLSFVTMGAPIGPPKQPYIPLKHRRFT